MHEKPDVVKTPLRNMVIMPEMIGSMVGVYNGKTFTAVEIKVDNVISLSYCFECAQLIHICRPR